LGGDNGDGIGSKAEFQWRASELVPVLDTRPQKRRIDRRNPASTAASGAAKPTTGAEAVRDRVFAARRRCADATQCLRQYLSRIVPVQAFRSTDVQVRYAIDGQRPNDRAESTYPRNRVSLIVHSTRIDTVVLALDSIREARIRVS
jgi:hypothetical protein